jgi:8-oxo-dGTP pyrophosphatase MutT (NUDIX family)
MHIKIYFGDKPVYLCDALDTQLQEIVHHPDAVFIDEFSPAAIKSLLHEIVKEVFHAGVILHSNLNELKKSFCKLFEPIEAAGGIVINDKDELLFIYRLGKWDLPKGKLEKGENIETCAIREVEEETGVSNITMNSKAGETYHTYTAYGKHFIKTTHWFYMSCSASQILVPQTEEDITEIKWVNKVAIAEQLLNTYPSIKDILLAIAKE